MVFYMRLSGCNMCVAPLWSQATDDVLVMPDDVEGHYHVTNTSLPVIPTNSVDKIVDKELRSKTTARYFISIQVRYSLLRFGT
jgi:hypothetical protein